MEGVTTDFVDVYGRKPADQKPPENETNRIMQKHDYLVGLKRKTADKNCVVVYFNTNAYDEWEMSSYIDLYANDCSNSIKDDVRDFVSPANSREEMNVICESPTSKFAYRFTNL